MFNMIYENVFFIKWLKVKIYILGFIFGFFIYVING